MGDDSYFEVHALHEDNTKSSFGCFADLKRAEKHR